MAANGDNRSGEVSTIRRRHARSLTSDVFTGLGDSTSTPPGSEEICLEDQTNCNETSKEHVKSGSTSSTSGCESLATTLGGSSEHLNDSAVVGDATVSNISPSQDSSCSSLEDGGSGSSTVSSPVTFYTDSDINAAVNPPKGIQYGCPNVSLSPIIEHRLSSISSISSGRNNSFDDGDAPQTPIANVLVVSHGGLLQQIIGHLLDCYQCKIPGGKKFAMQTSPNTGLSRFMITIGNENELPKVICLTIHDRDHLVAEGVSPLQQTGEA